MVKCTGRGLVVKRPGVLSKVQMLNLVLGVGVFSLLPIHGVHGELSNQNFYLVLSLLELLADSSSLALWWHRG